MQGKRGTLSGLRKSPRSSETYDSHLERDYMVELDHDPAVHEWTKEHGVTIPYSLLGVGHKYHPDFLITYNDGSKQLHETKGLPLMFWITTKLKRQSAEEYCEARGWKYKMVTKGWRWR
ncbi:MAG: TnsA endonuclease N-terminal domain-containing protein [Dehalococcoidia bacterium]